MASSRSRRARAIVASAAALVCVTGLTTGPARAAAGSVGGVSGTEAQPSACQLANGIKHVIDIQFDNVHFTRDNPNVPSDLEQMPNLLGFLKANGTVLSDDHDVLVHTATNFTSNQTGLYEDRTSMTQSNSYDYFDSAGATHSGVSFAYWTDPVYDPSGHPADTNYNMDYSADPANNPVTTNTNVPAPWVPYTKAGCNVGDVGMANEVLENVATDIPTVFGAGSPEAAEAAANPTKATADYVGLAVHCAQGAALCANGQTDALPTEPGGYTGYQGLFGNAQIQPAISPAGPITDLDGNVINDGHGNDGFPGFNSLTPVNSLSYAANMLEHGVQVANVYVSDVHTDHSAANTGDLGPGEQTYEQQLQAYDTAFGQFITRLAGDGINASNTLFAITTDEGDHFSGSAPTPATCTGAPGDYCTYATKSEVNVNLTGLLATQDADTQKYAIHSDPAPALWVAGNPAPNDPALRQTERNIGALTITNPLTGGTDQVANYLADPVEEKILHFVGPDAQRTPTLTAFSGEDDYIGGGAPNCTQSCVYTSQGYAWNHGSISPDMTDIWVAFAGPGVKHLGVDQTTWADQTDTRPTLLALTGLHDDYNDDGRVLIEDLKPSALPLSLQVDQGQLLVLGDLYKQIDASDGQFAKDTLTASTRGLESGSATDDSTYTSVEASLTSLDTQRDAIAAQMNQVLLGAAFSHQFVNPWTALSLTIQAELLLGKAHKLANA